jgi:hypothetical protein
VVQSNIKSGYTFFIDGQGSLSMDLWNSALGGKLPMPHLTRADQPVSVV